MGRLIESANPHIKVVFTNVGIELVPKYLPNTEKWIFKFDEYNYDICMMKQHMVSLVMSIMSSDFFSFLEKVEALNYINAVFEEVYGIEV